MIITLQTLMFFRESLVNVLDQWLRPYFKKFSLTFSRRDEISDDEESDEHVFADFDEERGVVFYPPVYQQRYAAVSDCLLDERWCGKLEKVVDLGYHDMSFIKYLKDVQGIKSIMAVDIESISLRCSSDIFAGDNYVSKRENPLEITLFKGNAADPDYRLIGTDAVVAIEMIEHMLPHDLERLIHTVFGFVKPRVAIFTTPNGDFNVLFKALEKNGLRRLDHFFEWSREQFHDWCSNIVARYPQYTVSCKGIGPGPSGTKHLGCCSQMSVFIAKDYSKQPNLNLNSLALVPESVSPNSISNLVSSWESIPNESHMIEPAQNIKSYSELVYSEKESSITLVLTASSLSSDTIPYQEKASQCDLDTEAGKNYLMFDYEQMCFDVLVPTKKMVNRVYEIEDVNSRLNCTTLQVKKFSKTTQNLMAKNKLDVLVHTREVVEEIRHLTKMLNFNQDCNKQLENGTHTWCNINWGDNAPYWNQYYKTVKQYTYPFETKSDEVRILDLISDEINRLIDTQFDDEWPEEPNKVKIPIGNLMKVVDHITDDVEKVKDLLEWNGYEIIEDMVIHSRLVVDNTSVDSQEYDSQDTDIYYSDWDSIDIRSTTMSDGSTLVPDHYARCLRRALEQKVRKLRSVLIADEDITTELDLVVCRLMKLALQTSRGRNAPPLTIWMQCKLLDLLTLTEKTIERRKKHFIENYSLKAINCDERSEQMTALDKIKGDNTASKIVDKYEHLLKQPNGMEEIRANYRFVDLEVDDLSVSTGDFGNNYDYDYGDKQWTDFIGLQPALLDTEIFDSKKDSPEGECKLKRTQAWVDEDMEVVPYPSHGSNFDNSSIETDINNASVTKYYKKRYKGKKCVELNCVICKKSHSKVYKRNRPEERIKENAGNTKHLKKVSRKKSINHSVGLHTDNKFVSVDYKTYKVKSRRRQHKPLCQIASKPITASLVDICQIDNVMESCNNSVTAIKSGESVMLKQLNPEVAETKQSLLIDIITEETQETIALRRTIGTDVHVDPMSIEEETLIRSYSNTLINEDDSFEKHNVAIGDVNSLTIFLYDIDEPTTSKGIRHTGMDVQCGPDAIAPTNSMLSATTSLTRMPKMFSAGIKIGDATTDPNVKSSIDCCTCTYDGVDTNSYKTILPRERSIGIEIKDSYSDIKQTEFSRISKMDVGFKIEDSNTDTNMKSTDSSECANDAHSSFKHVPRERSVGFTIKGSTTNSNKQFKFPTVPANSMLSATTSLTRMPQMFTVGIKITDSTPDVRIKSTDCGTRTYACDSYNVLLRDQCVGIETKDSYSNLIKQIKFSTVTTCPMLTGTASLTRMSTTVTEGVRSGESTSNTIIKSSDRGISTYGYNTTKSVLPIEKSVEIKIKNFETEFTAVPECSVLSATTSLTSIPQPMEFSTNTQESIHELKTSSPQSLPNKRALLKPKPKQRSIGSKVKVPGANTPSERERLRSTQGHYEKSNVSTPRSVSKDATLLKSIPKQKSEEYKDSSPRKERSVNSSNYDKLSNASSPIVIETDLSNLPTGVKTEDSKSDLFLSVDTATLPMHCKKTLQNSDLQIISAVHKEVVIPGQLSNKYVTTKLCNGGLQVHSYRDKCMSEDIMYQGEWQKNRPKILTKKKLFNPIVSKKGFDSNLKRKSKSKEKLQKNSADLSNKSKAREITKNEMKFNRKITVTATVDKARKPFRNILKVPSNIIMSSVSSKKPKAGGIVKKPSRNTNLTTDTKDDVTLRKINNKNYIPLYLRKKAFKCASDIKPNDLNLSLDSAKCINQIIKSDFKTTKQKAPRNLTRSKTDEIKRDLLKFHSSSPIPQYVVLRNEIEQNNRESDRPQIQPASDSTKKSNNASRQRSVSPGTSPNSSSCSSPCSVATVRAVSIRSKNVSDQRHSTSSYRNSTVTSESESTTPTPERMRRFTKRSKSAKITADKVSDNKENLPQTSKQNNIAKKESFKLAKRSLMGQKKDVYIAHLKESPPLQLTVNTLSKHKSQKSNVNIPKANSLSQKRSLHIRSPSLSGRASIKCDIPLPTNKKEKVAETSQTSNMVLVIEPQARGLQSSDTPKSGNVNVVNHHLVTNWIDHSDTEAVETHASNIISAMKELIDETLDFIDDPLDRCIIDSETVILSREDLRIESVSPTSFKTTLSNNENSNDILQDDIEFALNRSFDTTLGNESTLSLEDMRLTVTDFDVLSFKSVTSMSKISDYLSAENESTSSPKLSVSPRNPTSVRDIFERKDQPFQLNQIQNTPGAVALQAFSGFSINGDPCPGDQPDYVNFMDSETGSLALEVARQATSEELFISGRSSGSYQSCLLDEDAVVPNWLFQIISQQQSVMDQPEVPAELANVEPMYDTNGNLVETPVVGTGAGDGRGMHSDDSQDSSGRGTSISSSDTSSGQQSEAILIDPSSFVAQFELLRDAVETSVVLAINDASESNAVGIRQAPIETESRSFSRGESRRIPRARLAATASDVDADVSSLDTDADAHDDSN